MPPPKKKIKSVQKPAFAVPSSTLGPAAPIFELVPSFIDLTK